MVVQLISRCSCNCIRIKICALDSTCICSTIRKLLAGDLLTCESVRSIGLGSEIKWQCPHHPRGRGSSCKVATASKVAAPRLEHAWGMVTVGQQQVRCAVQRGERPPRGAAHRGTAYGAR